MNNNKNGPKKETSTKSSVNSPDRCRRGALKRLVLGSTAAGVAASLPARWTRPIVQSVMLPAHAQTSPGDIEDGDFFVDLSDLGFNVDRFGGTGTEVASQAGWFDWLIPSAHAGLRPPEVFCEVCGFCARIRGGRVTMTLVGIAFGGETVEELCYEATGNIGGTASFSQVAGSDACPVPTTATIVRLEGEAPNRTLVVSDGNEDMLLEEDPSRNCNCSAFSCFR